MRAPLDILFNINGQVLYCDAPEGRPSAVTRVDVWLWDQSDKTTPEFSPAGTVDANPDTTTDVAAGADQADPRLVPLAATTGAEVGRTFLLASATLEQELVEVAEIDAGNSVTARHPLHNTYPIGSTFKSTRISAPVDATWVADETNIITSSGANPMYRVRWVYVVAGKTYVQDTYFNLVRYSSRHGVTPQDVEAAHASWLDRLPTDHRKDQGRRLIDEAYREVRFDLLGIDLPSYGIAESEVVDELVRAKAVALSEYTKLLAGGDSGDRSRFDLAASGYKMRLDGLLRLVQRTPIRKRDGDASMRIAKPLFER